ncbi:hypothetical protein HDR58_07420 [bacterium]|nr:hypothetical protein [bacterium]
MKKAVAFLIIFLLSMTIVKSNETDSQTMWKRVDSNSFIYQDGIIGTEDIYGFSFLLKAYNKGQYEPVSGKRILYTLTQYTIDCDKKKYKIGVIDSYGERDNFISGDYNKYAQFQPIVSGTSVASVAEKLCKP